MRGPSGVASDNRRGSNQPRLGASAEGRLAWPQAPSPSGHLCKPTRPQGPRVVFPRAPVILLYFAQRILIRVREDLTLLFDLKLCVLRVRE